ncbi:MAG: hypothetical protein JWR85_3593 [Marmoricola sp.]|nr:hypothetical protein [Marmoricola sp.]
MSEVNWNLAGPGFDSMQVLQAAGQTYPQRQQREQQQYARQADQRDYEQKQDQINFAHIDKLDERQRAEAKGQIEQFGQFALMADTPEKWDSIVGQYVQMGHPEAAQFLGKFSPQLRQTFIARAGEAKTYLDQQKPDYRVIPEGGYLQDVSPQGLRTQTPNTQAPAAAPALAGDAMEAQAQAAIAAGADPVAVRARMSQLRGGAGPQAPRSFP